MLFLDSKLSRGLSSHLLLLTPYSLCFRYPASLRLPAFYRHPPPQALCTGSALCLGHSVSHLFCPGSLLELRVPHHIEPGGWQNSVPCVCKAEIPVFLLVVGVQQPSGPSWLPRAQPCDLTLPQHGCLLLFRCDQLSALVNARTE